MTALNLLIVLLNLAPFSVADKPQTRSSLDFWIGEWEVFTHEGKKIGDNRIERSLNGAALFEHWKDVRGGEGKSLFYWAEDTDQWKQIWITPNGAYKQKTAEPIENGLLFSGTAHQPDGSNYPDRTRLTKVGDEVRQVIEISRDGGKSWQVVFDAVYKRPDSHGISHGSLSP